MLRGTRLMFDATDEAKLLDGAFVVLEFVNIPHTIGSSTRNY
jgi:hypothetical protein